MKQHLWWHVKEKAVAEEGVSIVVSLRAPDINEKGMTGSTPALTE